MLSTPDDLGHISYTPSKRQPADPLISKIPVVNMLCPDIGLGGAERIVADIIGYFRVFARRGLAVNANLFVFSRARPQYHIEGMEPWIRVWHLHTLPRDKRIGEVALRTFASGTPLLYTHMVPQHYLEQLWSRGIMTIPVIHNLSNRWTVTPRHFHLKHVPGVVAVADAVAKELLREGCSVPIHTIVHETLGRRGLLMSEAEKNDFRLSLGISRTSAVVGMVGKFKAQKRYDLAVRCLAELRKHTDATLVIVGPWKEEPSESHSEHEKALNLARELGVEDHVLCAGGTRQVARFYNIFDVFLNTSEFEGLSIATLEARSYGIPVVLSDAGGQSERLIESDRMVPVDAAANQYATCLAAALRSPRVAPPRHMRSECVPRLWIWIANYGIASTTGRGTDSVMFVTNNLSQGGAQRSLVNLLRGMTLKGPAHLCILDDVFAEQHLADVEGAGVTVFSIRSAMTIWERTDRILAYIRSARVKTVCFWNVEFRLKALLTKILQHEATILIDVSPGPQMFEGIPDQRRFMERIAFTPDAVFERTNHIVFKYSAGSVPSQYGHHESKVRVISNGVPDLPANNGARPTRPRGVSPAHAIVCSGRIVPSKLVHHVLLVAARLRDLDPHISLTFVGKVEGDEHAAYWQDIKTLFAELRLEGTVFFVGESIDAPTFLREFKVLLMLSKMQGCPNASLEAMMAGLPVVANPDGGTAEQVEDGTTGFLVDENDIEAIAHKLKWLLDHPDDAIAMGTRGREKALREFSMDHMYRKYESLLWPASPATQGSAEVTD